MKSSQDTTRSELGTTKSQVAQWAQAFMQLHARLAPHFARSEPRRRVLAYLQGLMSCIERKNGWQLAEHGRRARPYGMQRLLSQAVWDADGVRDESRVPMCSNSLGTKQATWSLTKRAFLNAARTRAEVQKQ